MAAVIDWHGPYRHSPSDPEQFIGTIVYDWGEKAPLLYAGFGMGEQPDQLQVIGFAEDAAEYFRQLLRGEGQSDGGVQSASSVCGQYYLGWIKSQAIAGPQSRGTLPVQIRRMAACIPFAAPVQQRFQGCPESWRDCLEQMVGSRR